MDRVTKPLPGSSVSNPQLGGISTRPRLRPYQVEGVSFLTHRSRAMLADEMGL